MAEMEYGSDMNEVAPDPSAAAALETPPGKPEGEQMGGSILEITPDMIPQGMKVNPGDVLEFKVTGMEGGKILATYNTGDDEGKEAAAAPPGEQTEGAGWEQNFRKEMSPRNGEETAM